MTTNETFSFEAETGRLLDLMISAVYSEKEIFLRELISNASDALDKLRFAALTDPSLVAGEDPEIRIETDEEKRTVSVIDNGIGMTREEVKTLIGTIARSGTREMLADLQAASAGDIPKDLIGQFGVGFYSSFIAASRVVLETKRAGADEPACRWESDGKGTYSLGTGTRTAPGTEVTLFLRDVDEENGLEDFTKEWVLRRVVKEHSDFVRYPVKMKVRRETGEGEDKKTIEEYVTLNSQKALWLRPQKEVEENEFNEFYRQVSHDWNPPLTHVGMQAEGRLEYRALLYIPSKAPRDIFFTGYKKGLQLYVKNVKILDRCEDFLPDFLRFVSGVVDSDDIPLNLSREMVQFSRLTAQIRSALSKKVLETLEKQKADNNEKYLEFYKDLGAVLKEGVVSSPEHREKLLELLLFESSADPTKLTSLEEYVSRMKEDQTEIYYLAGESRKAVEASPHLEAATAKGYEVLYMTDAVDEFVLPALTDYKGKHLKSVGKGEIEFGSELEKETKRQELENIGKDFEPFLKALNNALADRISDVKLSTRLTTSPVCLVGSESGLSPHVERLIAQNKMDLEKQKRVLEVNPKHEVIEKMNARFRVRPDDPELSDNARLLYNQALLAEGSTVEDPADFSRLLTSLMSKAL